MIVWTKVVAVEINIIYMIEVIEEMFDEKGQGSQILNKKLMKEGTVGESLSGSSSRELVTSRSS